MKNNISNIIAFVAGVWLFSTVFAMDAGLADGVVAAKYFWFYGAMGGGSAAMAALLFFKKANAFRFSVADVLVLTFALTGILTYLFNNQTVDTNFVLLALTTALYFYFRFFLSFSEKIRSIFAFLLILTALAEGVWGLLQLYGFLPSQHSGFRLTGSFFNPGPYAGYLACIAPVAFYLLFNHKEHEGKQGGKYIQILIKIISALTLAVILLVLPATMSRAAWLAALCGCGFVAAKQFVHLKRKTMPVLSVVLPILAVAAVLGMYHLKKNSADGRFLIWKNSIELVRQQPAGVGLGQFGGAYAQAQAAYFSSGNGSAQEELVAGSPEYAFNEYLQIAAEQGIAGLAIFLALVILCLYNGLKNKRFATVGALLALLIFAFGSYPFRILPFLILLAFLLADCDKMNRKNKESNKKTTKIWFVILFSAVVFCLLNRYTTYKAYREWKNLKMLYNMQIYNDLPQKYGQLYPALFDRKDFLFEYGQSLSKTGDYEQSNAVLSEGKRRSGDPMFYNIAGKNFQALKQYRQAEENFTAAANIVPNRLYPWYLLYKLYTETGDTVRRQQAAATLLTKEPKVQSTAVREMRKAVISD
jgi:O-antigen ligase